MKTPWIAAAMALLVAAGGATFAGAQTVGPQLTLSVRGGMLLPDDATRPTLDDGAMAAGSIGVRPHPRFGLEATYGAASAQQGGVDARANHVGLDALFHILPEARFAPYVGGGWAQLETDPDRGESQTLNGWEAIAGLDIRLKRWLGLRFDARDVMLEQDEDATHDEEWLHDPIVTAGLQMKFGGKLRDQDADGVADRDDHCPDTPAGAHIDAAGCPSDADGDGSFDGIDVCPDTPKGARVDAQGCPVDSDNDGIFDGLDQCADTPPGAAVDARGCPQDADADGVPDGVDQCPGTPAGARVEARGCPTDSDSDGVFDGLDRCPDTPAGARVDSVGCPIAADSRETELLNTGFLRLHNVEFQTGKADIRPESYATLDEIGTFLSKWPQLQIEVGGHTDSQGAAAANQKLSQQRARAVLQYLERHFPVVAGAHYTAVGYGETKPVGDNRTAAGRAANRRVELEVKNPEALEKQR